MSSDDLSNEQSGEQYLVSVTEQSEVERIRNLLLTIGVENFSELPPYDTTSGNIVEKLPTADNPFWFIILCNDEQYKILEKENINITPDSATLSTCDRVLESNTDF